MPFIPGKEYSRVELHNTYGGQQLRGIVTPAQHPLIMLFKTPFGEEFGYKDGWNNDKYYYTGEGAIGDMKFTAGNRAIRDHKENGKCIYIFESIDFEPEKVTCIGEFLYFGHHTENLPDHENNSRKAIVFELQPVKI